MGSDIKAFLSGTHNLIDSENIPQSAAQDSLNFITQDGKIVLSGGRKLLGAEGLIGKCTGLHIGYKVDGTKVYYAKLGTTIYYLSGSTWTSTTITGLGENTEYSFANYSSLAGAFTYINGAEGYYKIINSHPASPISLYNSAKNFYGKIIINSGRTILWDVSGGARKDPTGLYGSWIDRQNATVYTAVVGEVKGAVGSGILAFKAGGATRSCFGVRMTITATGEVFTDNYLGVLTGSLGGTGTINYATGAWTCSVATAGTIDYQWEDSNNHGVSDFSKSATRIAGEGFIFPQDEGGDAIQKVIVAQDGAFYSLKKQSAYKLELEATDLNANNQIYRKDLGILNWRAVISTTKGIIFINTANPSKPEMTILERNPLAEEVEPKIIFPHFDFGEFDYSDCALETYDRYILVFCKKVSSVNNDTILLCNLDAKTVDIIGYTGRMSIQDSGNLYIGDSLTKSVHQIFNGFDDLNLTIENYWIGKGEIYETERLKKIRKFRIQGFIQNNQNVEVYLGYEGGDYSLVGTIRGDGSYVDYGSPQVIGSNFIGEAQIGGDDITNVYPYFIELKLKTPKFRKRTIKLVATGVGYFDCNSIIDWDIILFENRIPKQYRSKQNVSLDGSQTNI
jgi:hypothetical protein